MRFAEDLGAEPIRVQGSDVAKALMQVPHDKNVGSIVIGHSRHGRLLELLHRTVVHKLMRLASDVEVHVVSDRERERVQPHWRRRMGGAAVRNGRAGRGVQPRGGGSYRGRR